MMTREVYIKSFCYIPKSCDSRKIICMSWATLSHVEYSLHLKEWMTPEDLCNLAKQCITYKKSYISIRDSVWKKALGILM